jgi:uncharacterized membrane protein YfcA
LPDIFFLLLSAALFLAAALQAATGIGFGLIASPALLVSMTTTGAVQVSSVLNFLIAVLMVPGLYRHIDFSVCRSLGSGFVFGLPAGVLVLVTMPAFVIKILALLIILLALVALLRNSAVRPVDTLAAHSRTSRIGALAGALSGALAMPGPPIAAHLAALGMAKDQIRATVLFLYIFAYSATLAAQIAIAGMEPLLWQRSVMLIPAIVLGLVAGSIGARFLSEQLFRNLIKTALTATICGLVLSLSGIY